jgi:hypothetical protein
VRHSRRACALLHQSPQLLSSHLLLNVFHGGQLRLDAAFSLAGSFVSTDGRIGVSAEGWRPAVTGPNIMQQSVVVRTKLLFVESEILFS